MMIELTHSNEPAQLVKYRSKNPNSSWGDEAFNPIREITRRSLNLEQQGLCVYCEQFLLQDHGHVEHIKSKSKPESRHLRFVYSNLAHSCNGGKGVTHCGHAKKSDRLPIEPRVGCNQNFSVSLFDGRLSPSINLTESEKQSAQKAIDLLNLNENGLSWKRYGFAASVIGLGSQQEKSDFLSVNEFRWVLRDL
jgi:TIGR02646 family protein